MSEDVDGYVDETLPCNIGTTFKEFSQHDRKIVRSLESLGKKHTNDRYAVTFIDACVCMYVCMYVKNVYVKSGSCRPTFCTNLAAPLKIVGFRKTATLGTHAPLFLADSDTHAGQTQHHTHRLCHS